MAYNLHTLSYLKFVMERSLVSTLASKHKTTCGKIYKKFGAIVENDECEQRKVIQVKVNSLSSKTPLTTHFGAISLKWNKWVIVNDNLIPIWNKRSEIIQRLLAQNCELCKSQEQIEVHHVRKLADLRSKSNTKLTEWKKRMIERKRKTLVVCHECHKKIQYGKYDGDSLKRKDYRRAM